MKNNKIIVSVIVVAVLLFAFFYGGNINKAPNGKTLPNSAVSVSQQEKVIEEKTEISEKQIKKEADTKTEEKKSDTEVLSVEKNTEQPYKEEKAEENSLYEERSEAKEAEELTCTLSVRCDTILSNPVLLNSEKINLVPEDGVIFSEKTVVFYEGESVFNVLLREMKKNKIHLEFVNAPMYNSAYIEGINNIYEFDCGELSGWMYKVNGYFPNYGCSRYLIKNGDKVEWVYTCDLGVDVGGDYSSRNGK